MKNFLIPLTLIFSSTLLANDIPHYVDLTGTYTNPRCTGDIDWASKDLIQKYSSEKNFKLIIEHKKVGAISNGEEFFVSTIDAYSEYDYFSGIDLVHKKSETISRTIYDSRTGCSLDPGYRFIKEGLVFKESRKVISTDILGYRRKSLHITNQLYKLVDDKLIIDGTLIIKTKTSNWNIPTGRSEDKYHFNCVYDKN